MVNRVVKKTIITLTIAILVAACSNTGKASKDTDAADVTPVTLKIYLWDGTLFQVEAFQKFIADPVKKKYPNISLEPVARGKNAEPTNLVADNTVDIIMAWNDVLVQFQDLQLIGDITPEVKKTGADLGRFDPIALDSMRDPEKKEILYGLPFAQDFYALFYNKDIFDKFGIAYPKDGMNWEDVTELARRLTREVDGQQYKGLDPAGPVYVGASLPMQLVDPKPQKATIDNGDIKKMFETLKQIYGIPGNENTIATHASTVSRFGKDRNVAMYGSVGVVNALSQYDVNWDMVQYPSFKDKPNQYGKVKAYALCITTTSKYRDQAMKVLEVMTSDEVQLAFTKSNAMLSTLKNPEINKHFGEDLAFLKGKNIAGIYKSKPAPFVPQSVHSGKALSVLNTKFNDVMKGKDINTALREAQEEANKQIEALKN